MASKPDLARFMYEGEDLSSLVHFLVKGGLNKAARDDLAAATARFISKAVAASGVQIDPALDTNDMTVLTALRDTGYAPVRDIFSGPQIDEIQNFLADMPVTYEIKKGIHAGQRQSLVEAIPENVRLAHYSEADLCRCPLIYNLLHDHRLINLVGTYLGAPPTISAVASWWSFPDKSEPDKDQPFHHDRDDFSIAKLFVYLTDVTPVTGPHAYVLQTHNTDVLRKFTTNTPQRGVADEATFWAWMEKFFKPDNEIFRVFGAERVKILTGPRGTSFLEDTRGLHRAVYPRTGFRLAFEIMFTVLPKYNEPHAPVLRRGLGFLDKDLETVPPPDPIRDPVAVQLMPSPSQRLTS